MHAWDNLTSADLAIRLYKIEAILDTSQTEVVVSSVLSPDVPLLQMFQGKDPKAMVKNLLTWRVTEGQEGGKIVLARVGRCFQQRVACPLTLEQVDLKKNFKPTALELYLALVQTGWSFKTWPGKHSELARTAINLDPESTSHKSFYRGSFYYLLCLVTLPPIMKHVTNKNFMAHGLTETYYASAFHLAQEQQWSALENLARNKSAAYYRTPPRVS